MGSVDVRALSSLVKQSEINQQSAVNRILSGSEPRTGPMVPASFSSSTVGTITSFQGLNETQGGGYVPPDVVDAAGPSHIVEMVNLAGEIFTKQGTLIENFPLASFFLAGPLTQSHRMSDPQVLYDAQSQRWFASIIDLRIVLVGSQDFSYNNVTIAVSGSSDPTGTWKVYSVRIGEVLPDQPVIGVSDDKFVVSVNDFDGFVGPFIGAQYWVLNKNEMVAGSSAIDLDSFGPDGSLESVHPAQSLSPTTTQYMVTTGAGQVLSSSNLVQLFAITGTPPLPVTVNKVSLTVSSVFNPPAGAEPNPSYTINTGDHRVLRAVWFQDNLWYSLTDSCVPSGDTTSRSCARFTEINTAGQYVAQDFDLGAPGQYYYYPAVSMDGNGNMEAIYGYSSSTIYPSLAVAGQLSTDPANAVAQPITLQVGSAIDSSGRYGDYFGAAPDPSDPTLVWVGGEYNANSAWSTVIGSITMTPKLVLSANPAYLDIATNSSATSTISVRSAGFSGIVSLSATISSANGPTASFNPSSVTLSNGANANSTLRITVPSTTPVGPHTITVTATGTGVSKQLQIPLTVGPDFTLTANPASISIQAGSTATSTLTLTSLNSLAGTITLSGVSVPAGPSISLTPASVTLLAGGTATSTLSINSNAPGFFTITVIGTKGSLRHAATLTLLVVGFTMSTNPGSFAVPAASSGTSKLAISSANGFGGNVQLSVTVSPTGPTASFSSPRVILPVGGSNSSILTVSVPSGTAAGVYTITVAGTNASESATVQLTTVVTPISVNINNTATFTGVKVVTAGTLSVDSPSSSITVSGTVSVTATNATTGTLLFSKTYTITKYPVGSVFLLNVGVTPYPLASVNKVTLSGSTASDTVSVYRTPDINGDGIVNRADLNIISASNGCSLGQTCYNPRADLNADGLVDITDLATAAIDYLATDFIPNFTVSASNTPLLVLVRGSSSMAIPLTSANGFAGTVSLSTITSSTVSATLSPTSATLTSGGSTVSTLTVSSSTRGIFSVNVSITSGALSHSFLITVDVGDFSMFPDYSFLSFFVGGSSNTAIEIWPFDGLAGSITMSTIITPSTGLTATLTPNTVMVTAFGSHNSSRLRVVGTMVGGYTVNVTGTIGSLVESTIVEVNVCQRGTPCNQLAPIHHGGIAQAASEGPKTELDSLETPVSPSRLSTNESVTGASSAHDIRDASLSVTRQRFL